MKDEGRLAAVTGATGFLGRYIVRALADDGWRMRVLARQTPSHPLWRGLEPQVVLGDLADAGALARLMDGAALVVHTAGLIKARSRAAFDAVNVTGTKAVAAAAPVAAHLLLVSSLAARAPELSDYAASKRGGEAALAALAPDRFTIVRPPGVYGPWDRETLALFKAARTWPALPVLNPAARTALIHAADAAAQIAALGARTPANQTFALSDARPDGYAWSEIMQALAAAVGRRPPLARVPETALRAAGVVADISARLSPGTPILSSGKIREFLHPDWSVPPGQRPPDMPAPRFNLVEGFATTAAWYESEGWLQQPGGCA